MAAATLAVFVGANLAYPDAEADLVWTGMFTAIIVAFVLVGALLAVRVPANPIGPIILGSGALLATTVAIGTAGIIADQDGRLPIELVAVAAILNDLGFIVPIIVILIGIPLIFPDGRLLSPRWRWVVVLAASALAALAVAQIIGPGPIGAAEIPNPFAVPALEPLANALDAYASWTSIVGFGAAMSAVAVRYRRGTDVERHQLKWFIADAAVAAVAFPIAFIEPVEFSDALFLIGLLALFALPLAIAVAILRYRLYDIDRIISRTLSWTIVTGLLLGVFIALVIGLQAALADVTQGSTLAVAASTLIAFALFQPVRRRVQTAVDRRFDRARYDARRTADAFAERLRHTTDLDTLTAELGATVGQTVRPTTTSIWIPERSHR